LEEVVVRRRMESGRLGDEMPLSIFSGVVSCLLLPQFFGCLESYGKAAERWMKENDKMRNLEATNNS